MLAIISSLNRPAQHLSGDGSPTSLPIPLERMTARLQDTWGFSLLEMMVAMVILMVGLLGLLTTINLAMQQNTQNQLRELAVGVGEEQLHTILATPVDSLLTYTADTVRVTRPFRGYSTGFNVARETKPLGADSAEVWITVSWKQKGVNYQHQLQTIKSR